MGAYLCKDAEHAKQAKKEDNENAMLPASEKSKKQDKNEAVVDGENLDIPFADATGDEDENVEEANTDKAGRVVNDYNQSSVENQESHNDSVEKSHHHEVESEPSPSAIVTKTDIENEVVDEMGKECVTGENQQPQDLQEEILHELDVKNDNFVHPTDPVDHVSIEHQVTEECHGTETESDLTERHEVIIIDSRTSALKNKDNVEDDNSISHAIELVSEKQDLEAQESSKHEEEKEYLVDEVPFTDSFQHTDHLQHGEETIIDSQNVLSEQHEHSEELTADESTEHKYEDQEMEKHISASLQDEHEEELHNIDSTVDIEMYEQHHDHEESHMEKQEFEDLKSALNEIEELTKDVKVESDLHEHKDELIVEKEYDSAETQEHEHEKLDDQETTQNEIEEYIKERFEEAINESDMKDEELVEESDFISKPEESISEKYEDEMQMESNENERVEQHIDEPFHDDEFVSEEIEVTESDSEDIMKPEHSLDDHHEHEGLNLQDKSEDLNDLEIENALLNKVEESPVEMKSEHDFISEDMEVESYEDKSNDQEHVIADSEDNTDKGLLGEHICESETNEDHGHAHEENSFKDEQVENLHEVIPKPHDNNTNSIENVEEVLDEIVDNALTVQHLSNNTNLKSDVNESDDQSISNELEIENEDEDVREEELIQMVSDAVDGIMGDAKNEVQHIVDNSNFKDRSLEILES